MPMLLLACTAASVTVTGPEDTGEPVAGDGAAASPTWHADVAPLVSASCGGCHTDGGIAPFVLDSYEAAAPMASAMADATASGAMPPWGAQETDECARPAWAGRATSA
jgi:hypothetical protein